MDKRGTYRAQFGDTVQDLVHKALTAEQIGFPLAERAALLLRAATTLLGLGALRLLGAADGFGIYVNWRFSVA